MDSMWKFDFLCENPSTHLFQNSEIPLSRIKKVRFLYLIIRVPNAVLRSGYTAATFAAHILDMSMCPL